MFKRLFALLLCAALLAATAGCGRTAGEVTDGADIKAAKTASQTDAAAEPTEAPADEAPDFTITSTPAQQLREALVSYTDPNGCFTAVIPEGWAVSTAGYDMYYWIRIYDPAQPDLQVFTLLKTECLLMNDASKSFYESMRGLSLYTMFADMIVVERVEDFYSGFMDFCSFVAQYEPTYAGFEYPQISAFETLESFPYGSYAASAALEDTMLHATFEDYYTGQTGEGMFTGTLCRGFESGGVGCNMLYNINAVTAPYGELAEYESLLAEIFASIQYTDTFISTVMYDLQLQASAAQQLNQTLTETSAIITEGWNARQQSYDIISQKQSDATLGYERVYDVETGEVYRAYNGFTDTPGVESYFLPVTDDMYSAPVAGYIEP